MHELINDFVSNSTSSSNACVVIGASASGKTRYCLDALNGTDFLNLEYEEIDSHADLVKRITNYITTPKRISILDAFKNINSMRTIFLDDVDILFSLDRFANGYIQESIKKYPHVKFLITCSTSEERKVTDIKKKAIVVRLLAPISEKIDAAHRLYFDMNIYQVVESMFDQRTPTFADTELAISLDPTLVSFIMYDNYKAFLSSYQLSISSIQRIHQACADAAKLEDVTFGSPDSHIAELPALLRCHTIRLMKHQTNSNSNCFPNPSVIYTQITSRSAQHFNVLKKHAASTELTPRNVALLAQVPKRKFNLKTNVGMTCQAFKYNIIDPLKYKEK